MHHSTDHDTEQANNAAEAATMSTCKPVLKSAEARGWRQCSEDNDLPGLKALHSKNCVLHLQMRRSMLRP